MVERRGVQRGDLVNRRSRVDRAAEGDLRGPVVAAPRRERRELEAILELVDATAQGKNGQPHSVGIDCLRIEFLSGVR